MNLEPPVQADALAAVRAPFAATGAAFIDAPVLLPLGPLLELAGEAMRGRLFIVQGDGEDACLRPDFTIPIALAHIKDAPGERRYLYEGKAFRVAPRGSGRAEEFLQIGLEAFGGGRSAEIDAEVAALAWAAAEAGGRNDLSMIMGDVSLFSALIDALALAPALGARLKRAFARPGAMEAEIARAQAPEPSLRQGDRLAGLLAGLPETDAAAALQDFWRVAGIQPVGGRAAAEIAHRLAQRGEAARAPRLTEAQARLIRDFLTIAGSPADALDQVAAVARDGRLTLDAPLDGWSRRLKALECAGAAKGRMQLRTSFGRAFGYYDGFLFEVRSAALEEQAPVAAGGRYNSLPARLGGTADGAVGCAVRPARAIAGMESAA